MFFGKARRVVAETSLDNELAETREMFTVFFKMKRHFCGGEKRAVLSPQTRGSRNDLRAENGFAA